MASKLPTRPSADSAAASAEPSRPRLTERKRRQIQDDLSRRGVAMEFSRSICDRLAPFSQDLTPEVYDAVLSGVAMAYGVQRRDAKSQDVERDLGEVERLLTGFGAELRKLDETLDTMSAFVSRLRRETRTDRGKVH